MRFPNNLEINFKCVSYIDRFHVLRVKSCPLFLITRQFSILWRHSAPVPGCAGHFLWAILVSLTSVPFMDAFVYGRGFSAQGHCSRPFILSKVFLKIPWLCLRAFSGCGREFAPYTVKPDALEKRCALSHHGTQQLADQHSSSLSLQI